MDRPWYAHYDPGVPHEVDYPKKPLYHLLKAQAERFPEHPAVDFLGRRIRYQELWQSTRRFARALQDLGLKPGDRVAIMLPNSPQYLAAFYGTLLAGGVVVNTNPLYTAHELAHQLKDSGARFLVMLDLLWPRFAEVESEVPTELVITTGIQDALPLHL